ncbi:MAG: hypothetical protein ABIK89_11760 [Planctomycetota bacterium]
MDKWIVRERVRTTATNPNWKKWLPSKPTSPHWDGLEEVERLVAACDLSFTNSARPRYNRHADTMVAGNRKVVL